ELPCPEVEAGEARFALIGFEPAIDLDLMIAATEPARERLLGAVGDELGLHLAVDDDGVLHLVVERGAHRSPVEARHDAAARPCEASHAAVARVDTPDVTDARRFRAARRGSAAQRERARAERRFHIGGAAAATECGPSNTRQQR